MELGELKVGVNVDIQRTDGKTGCHCVSDSVSGGAPYGYAAQHCNFESVVTQEQRICHCVSP